MKEAEEEKMTKTGTTNLSKNYTKAKFEDCKMQNHVCCMCANIWSLSSGESKPARRNKNLTSPP